MFNNFFINIVNNLSSKEPITLKMSCEHNNISFDDVFLKKIKPSIILEIINNFNEDTAAGSDKVTVKILKIISKNIIDPLVYIYNLSIEQSIFPDILKLAVVKPLFKSGDKASMNNYRPITDIHAK